MSGKLVSRRSASSVQVKWRWVFKISPKTNDVYLAVIAFKKPARSQWVWPKPWGHY